MSGRRRLSHAEASQSFQQSAISVLSKSKEVRHTGADTTRTGLSDLAGPGYIRATRVTAEAVMHVPWRFGVMTQHRAYG